MWTMQKPQHSLSAAGQDLPTRKGSQWNRGTGAGQFTWVQWLRQWGVADGTGIKKEYEDDEQLRRWLMGHYGSHYGSHYRSHYGSHLTQQNTSQQDNKTQSNEHKKTVWTQHNQNSLIPQHNQNSLIPQAKYLCWLQAKGFMRRLASISFVGKYSSSIFPLLTSSHM